MFGFFEKRPWSTDQIPDLNGRVAIVTGSNNGIGYCTALELTRHGAKTYLACRNSTKAKNAIDKIKAAVPGSDPQFLAFDLTSLNSAHSAAQRFLELESRLDILVNNAGMGFAPYTLSEDGIELQACNGTGHFAFTIPLINLLEKTSQEPNSHVRIVNVSSQAHLWAWSPDFSSLEGLNQKSYGSIARYGLSKLTNILFTNELQKRLKHTKIICTSVHPGGVDTNLGLGDWIEKYPILKILVYVKKWFLLTPEQGAMTSLYAATDFEVETKELRSAYLCPYTEVVKPSWNAQDVDGILGSLFWNLCEALVREKVR